MVREGGQVQWRRVATPPLHQGIRVAPWVSGVCGTDLQILRGERSDPAPILGHEGIVRVMSAASAGGHQLTPGQLAVINPTHPAQPALLLGHTVDGLLQERACIPYPYLEDGLIEPVTAQLHPSLAALIEPLAAVLYACQIMRPHVQRGPLLIYGSGTIGHLAAMLAPSHLPGIDQVVLVHRTAAYRDWSARTFPGLCDHQVIGESGATRPASAALMATPRTATLACLDEAIARLMPDGIINLLGGLPTEARSNHLPQLALAPIRGENCGGQPTEGHVTRATTRHGHPLRLTGQRGVSSRHLQQAIALLATPDHPFASLVTWVSSPSLLAQCLNDYLISGERTHEGRRFIKLAVSMT